MVKLKEGKLKWALAQKDKKNKELANKCGISIRRFQQLKVKYKETGEMPKLNQNRRPKTELTDKDKELIDKAVKESKLNNAVILRLYIDKYYNKELPYGKIHKYLLKEGISKQDKEKQKQRKYCRYERKHSFSLAHLDWHESKVFPGKQVCTVIDDASRLILSGGEFDHATADNSIKLLKLAIDAAWRKYSALILAVNTDKGPQFYGNNKTDDGEKALADFELFVEENEAKHIPSRRNHPQTNGKQERWFRTYEENRTKFNSFEEFIQWYNNRIHLGLNRKMGVTPNEAVLNKLRPESLLGLFFRRIN